jgi:hypothetical protein
MSGNYLQREDPRAEVNLPAALPHRPGARVRAEYQAERGNPDLSKWTFYLVGAPSVVTAGIAGIFGVVEVASGCERDPRTNECDNDHGGFWLGAAVIYGAIGGASWWWYSYSHEASFETYEEFEEQAPADFEIGIGPGGISGRF